MSSKYLSIRLVVPCVRHGIEYCDEDLVMRLELLFVRILELWLLLKVVVELCF